MGIVHGGIYYRFKEVHHTPYGKVIRVMSGTDPISRSV